ncbi:hypothetical protein HY933_02755 [Candidatus Falkowbacteria bacterium]|nr:hypothetical protein [Candidatus Falkowbacteria bacterium]
MMIGLAKTTKREEAHTAYAVTSGELFAADQSSFRYEKLLRSGSYKKRPLNGGSRFQHMGFGQ